MNDNPTKTRQHRKEVTASLAQACEVFLAERRRDLTVGELITRTLQLAPNLTESDLKDQLARSLSFLRFTDLDPATGKAPPKATYSLKPGLRDPLSELVAGVQSLRNVRYKRRAEDIALQILDEPALVKSLLTLPNSWSKTAFVEPEQRVVRKHRSTLPGGLIARVHQMAENSEHGSYDDIEQRILTTLRTGILVLVGGDIAFPPILLVELSTFERQLLLRSRNLEELLFARRLDDREILQQLRLQTPKDLELYVKQSLLPKVHRLLDRYRVGQSNA